MSELDKDIGDIKSGLEKIEKVNIFFCVIQCIMLHLYNVFQFVVEIITETKKV